MALSDSAAGMVMNSVKNAFSMDFRSRNWSVYGQWIGFLSCPVSIVLGVVNLLHVSLIIIFAIIALVQGLLVIFLEIPFLMRISPVTDRFTSFLKFFHQNLPRAGFYFIMAAIQYGGIGIKATSLIACAVMYTLACFSYLMAYITKQEFTTSATLGGDGVHREILA